MSGPCICRLASVPLDQEIVVQWLLHLPYRNWCRKQLISRLVFWAHRLLKAPIQRDRSLCNTKGQVEAFYEFWGTFLLNQFPLIILCMHPMTFRTVKGQREREGGRRGGINYLLEDARRTSASFTHSPVTHSPVDQSYRQSSVRSPLLAYWSKQNYQYVHLYPHPCTSRPSTILPRRKETKQEDKQHSPSNRHMPQYNHISGALWCLWQVKVVLAMTCMQPYLGKVEVFNQDLFDLILA